MEVTTDVSNWLKGLADLGCTFVEVDPSTKHTQRPWINYAHQVGQKGVSSALGWLRKGSGVGILPKPPLWILDADNAEWVERIETILMDAGIIPLLVRTKRGGHFYFLLPDSFPTANLKNHINPREKGDMDKLNFDLKFGPRTLLVTPGTVRADGIAYTPASAWRTPPIVDPRMFLPHGKFWREHRQFLIFTRPLKNRIARACYYLDSKAPIAISGVSGRATLAGVAAHLVVYLNLDPELAHNLMTHGPNPWNGRCIDKATGKPYPWNDRELWAACAAAVDSAPAAGVKAWEREQAHREAKAKLNTYVQHLKASLTRPGVHRVPVARVRRVLGWFGLVDLTAVALGDALAAHAVTRIKATQEKIQCIPGLDYSSLVNRILDAKRVQQVEERGTAGCPLMKHVASPGVENQVSTLPVENEVSTIFRHETSVTIEKGAA